MGWHKPREVRRTVFVRARLRNDAGWSDATICNVSSRGLMLKCGDALAKGAYVEVRLRSICIVGRVTWSHGLRCGVRTQDMVDMEALVSNGSIRPRQPSQDRRTAPQPSPSSSMPKNSVEQAEASRRFARAFEWSALALAVVGGAIVLTSTASTALDRPLRQARAALHSAEKP